MRIVALSLCLFGLTLGPARAEGELPGSVDATAQAIADASAKGDEAKLTALAARVQPDPWLVVDALLALEQAPAAKSFAARIKLTGYEGLAAYVSKQGEATGETDARKLLSSVNDALQRRAYDKAIALTEEVKSLPKTIVQIRLRHARGIAFFHLGQGREASAVLADAAESAATLTWYPRAADAFHWAGLALVRMGDLTGTRKLWQRRLTMVETLKDVPNVAIALGNLGTLLSSGGDFKAALDYQVRAIDLLRGSEHKAHYASMLTNVAGTYARLGQPDQGLASLREALALQTAAGRDVEIERIVSNLGVMSGSAGDYPTALAYYKRALESARKRKDARSEGRLLIGIGLTEYSLGGFAKAVRQLRRGIALVKDDPDPLVRLNGQVNLAIVQISLGEFPDAIGMLERVQAAYLKLGAKGRAAHVLGKLGQLYGILGDDERGMRYQREALAIIESTGDTRATIELLAGIATGLRIENELADAEKHIARFSALSEKIGDPYGLSRASIERGHIAFKRGDTATAADHFQAAYDRFTKIGERAEAASALGFLGRAQIADGKRDAGRKSLDRAIRYATRARATQSLVRLLEFQAKAQWAEQDAAGALASARRGLDQVEKVLGGLDEAGASLARKQYVGLFEVGILAALAEDRIPDAVTFIESGRAGALLESLEGGQAQRWADLPDELREAEAKAKAVLARALRSEEAAARSGKRLAIRAARDEMKTAQEGLREVAARIQREAKRQAGLFYPRAAPVEEIQAAIPEQQALVLYAFCLNRLIAIVLTSETARTVDLGEAAAARAACEALKADDPSIDAGPALDKLRALLNTPLGLAANTTHVMVSPDGLLGYIPFGAIFDATVSLTASGTTHVLLESETLSPGKRILAIGDPDYAGVADGAKTVYRGSRTLARLPATRAEVAAIGDQTLLGGKATEAGLRDATKTESRWRAVHLACHGLIDAERPQLSSLALTRAGDDDGFLTMLELLRMHIPADLATLSACEMATGRFDAAEGIFGITRAFMYAGAPRVLCSLWKVDDAATQALMVKFYELWRNKPELGAAGALKAAQAHIRAQEKWKHPYYWAAWVLWGLPS